MELGTRVQEQFRARYREFDGHARWVTDAALLDAFVEAADAGQLQVLEVCCGTGQVGAALAQAGAHVVGADISAEMLELAAPRLAETILGDARALPMPDACFERLVLRQAWHFLDPAVAPAELFRVAAPGAVLVTGQIVPFGQEDEAYLRQIHQAKQADLDFFPTEEGLARDLEAAGWLIEERREVLVQEEINAWLRHAPETGERAPEVIRLIREAPEPYRSLHAVREDDSGLWDTFRWVLLTARKPGAAPTVAPELLAVLRCPECHGATLFQDEARLRCEQCGMSYPVDAGVPIFTPGAR